jgi:hypothetical protein
MADIIGPRTSTSDKAVYVVQARDTLPDPGAGERWTDVVTVAVPRRTKRRTVIERALQEDAARHVLDGREGLVLRVLDAVAAEEIPVEWEQPPPQLKIGSAA